MEHNAIKKLIHDSYTCHVDRLLYSADTLAWLDND